MIAALGLVVLPNVAWAGCANYFDGSLSAPAPKVELCVSGLCYETVVVRECGNIHGSQVWFGSWWKFWDNEDSSGGLNTLYEQNVTLADATCRSLDPDYGACPVIDAPTN
jgi:hypothetical protein